MGLLLAGLRTLLSGVLGAFLLKMLTAAGIGLVAYKGADVLLTQLQTFIVNTAGGGTAEVVNVLNYVGFFTGLNMIIGAAAARVGTGTLYKLAIKATST